MKFRTIFYSLLVTAAVTFQSCKKSETTSAGVEYKVIKEGVGELPPQGDFVVANLIIKNETKGDTTLMESFISEGQPFVYRYDSASFARNNVLGSVQKLIKKGDSVEFKIPADSLLSKGMIPPAWGDSTDVLVFYLGAEKVLNQQEMQEFGNEMREKMMKKAEENSKVQLEKDAIAIDSYLNKEGIQFKTTESGVRYVVKSAKGKNSPKPGDKVVVHYAGRLFSTDGSGEYFDTSMEDVAKEQGIFTEGRNYSEAFSFTIGQGQVIKGWDEGLAILGKGDKATLYIPSSLAYGERAMGVKIPANSILVFDVELIDFETPKEEPAK